MGKLRLRWEIETHTQERLGLLTFSSPRETGMTFPSVGPLWVGEPAALCFLGGCGRRSRSLDPGNTRKSAHTPAPARWIQVAAIWWQADCQAAPRLTA